LKPAEVPQAVFDTHRQPGAVHETSKQDSPAQLTALYPVAQVHRWLAAQVLLAGHQKPLQPTTLKVVVVPQVCAWLSADDSRPASTAAPRVKVLTGLTQERGGETKAGLR
jgi:hypothetical protein